MFNVPKLRFGEFEGEWVERKLGDITQNIMYGMNSSAIKYDGVNKYIRITDIDESSRNFIPNPLTSPDGKIEEKFQLEEGDILFARTGASTGKSYIYKKEDGNLYFAGFLIKVNVNGAIPYFVFSYTLKDIYSKWVSIMSVRSGQPGINAEEYKLLKLYLPLESEQEKIATYLTSIDQKTEQLTQKKTLLESYKKGVMQKIFSQELRFKRDDGGVFEDWEEKRLGDISDTMGGGTPDSKKKEYWDGNIPWISSSDIKEDNIQDIEITRFITEEAINESATKIIPKNSILIVSRVGIGKFAVAKQELCTSQDFTNLITKENSFFLAYYFQAHSTRFVRLSQGTSIKGFTGKDVKNSKFLIPQKEEQQKIANFLTSLDQKITQSTQQIEAMKSFKKGLLQGMFV